MRIIVSLALLVCFALACGLGAVDARADSISGIEFTRITSNASQDVASQLNLDILDSTVANSTYGLTLASDEVLFVYTNAVGIQSAISEVFIDDGTVVSQSAVHNSLGGFTDFSGGGSSPGNLPSGNNVDPVFVATNAYAADAVGNPDNGVNAIGDILGISYVVNNGLTGLRSALADGTLRVGMHLRSIGTEGESDSFVNTPVPEPGTLALLALGLGLGAAARRRHRSRRAS